MRRLHHISVVHLLNKLLNRTLMLLFTLSMISLKIRIQNSSYNATVRRLGVHTLWCFNPAAPTLMWRRRMDDALSPSA